MEADDLLARLNDTELGDRLKALNSIYEDLDRDESRFCESFDVHCKSGCGSCCEHFIPDITRIESEYLAFGLAVEGRQQEILDLVRDWDPENPVCPLYRFDTPFHCSVYRWRPLICRLFGACAVKDKEGRPQFRHCKWNKVASEISMEDLQKKPEDVIYMGDYGMRMEELEINDNQTELLPKAIGNALFEVDMILRYANGDSDDNGGGMVPPESSPNAS